MTLDMSAEDLASTAEAIQSLADEETTSTGEGDAAPEPEQEAQAADELSDSETQSDEDLAQESQEEPKPAGRSQKLQKLIDSKGGEEKLAESVYNQMNSAKALAKKVQELEERLTEVSSSVQQRPAEPEPPIQHPDLAVLQQDIQALDAEAASLASSQRQVLIEISKTERNIAILEGQMLKSDDYEKSVLKSEKFQFEQALKSLEKEYKDLELRGPRLQRERREVLNRLQSRYAQLEADRAQARSRATEEKTYRAAFKTRFENAVHAQAEKFGVPEASLDFLMDTAKAKASVFLRGLPEGSPGLDSDEDMNVFIAAAVAKYAEDRGLVAKKKFTDYSRNKLQAASGAPRAESPRQQSSTPATPKTAKEANSAAFWRQRAAKILG